MEGSFVGNQPLQLPMFLWGRARGNQRWLAQTRAVLWGMVPKWAWRVAHSAQERHLESRSIWRFSGFFRSVHWAALKATQLPVSARIEGKSLLL